MRMQKRNGNLRWYLKFDKLSNIRSYAQVQDDNHMYVCGDYSPNMDALTDDSEWTAGIARVKNDGSVKWYHEIKDQTNADRTAAKSQDRCFGVSYSETYKEITALIQVKSRVMRTNNNYASNFYDMALIQYDPSGDIHRAVVISNYNLEYDMYAATQGIFTINKSIYFAGWSYGYKTRAQELAKDIDNPDYDSYVYRYDFEKNKDSAYQCLYADTISTSTVKREFSTRLSSADLSSGAYTTLYTDRDSVQMTKKNKWFTPWLSRYSGGFDLMDTMKIPRPCAYKSANLTSAEYYRGQNPTAYYIT